MSDSVFREGGPYRVRLLGGDRYGMSVPLLLDDRGMVGRECPHPNCSPAYFKLKFGTGITGEQAVAYCPYCRHEAAPAEFHTRAQLEYMRRIVQNEAIAGVQRMMRDAFGLGVSGRKKLGGGLVSIEMSYKPAARGHVSWPLEEELQRNLRCPHCGLEHAVFGLAIWCPDCGADLFLSHVHDELDVTRKILDAVDARRESLGARVAARDVENALEDVVSGFEAVLKLITRRILAARGVPLTEIDEVFRRRIRNTYQSVPSAAAMFKEQLGQELVAVLSQGQRTKLETVFEKRHPITHNMGIVDRSYLRRVQIGELEGREVRVTVEEVREVVDLVEIVLQDAYRRAFPDHLPTVPVAE